MNGKEYQELAMRTNDNHATKRLLDMVDYSCFEYNSDLGGVLNGCLGLAGESGEALDMVKKWIFHEKELDIEHFKKELGDVLWYVAMICDSFGFDMDEIMEMNIEKLKARYPKGFSVERSNNRMDGDV